MPASTSPTFVGLKGQNLIYEFTFCCSIGFLLFGYDLGYMGGLTTSQPFLDVFGNPNVSLLGFLVSSYEVGALFGALSQFALGDRYGRKTNNIFGAIIVALGAVLQCTTYSLARRWLWVGHHDHRHLNLAHGVRHAQVSRSHDGNAALEPHHGPDHSKLARLLHEFLCGFYPMAFPLCLPDPLLHYRRHSYAFPPGIPALSLCD